MITNFVKSKFRLGINPHFLTNSDTKIDSLKAQISFEKYFFLLLITSD